MYDADYDNYLNELRDEAETAGFVVRDSGSKVQYNDGMQRDDPTGKPKFGLMWPKGVPLEEQLIYRVAMHYMHGGEKYGDRNWEKSCTGDSLAAHEEALWRHFTKFYAGVEDGEDHAAAVVWGINAVLLTRRNIAQKALKEEIAAARGDEVEQAGTIDPATPPEWALYSARCCHENPAYSSLPFTYDDGCGKGQIASTPLVDLGDMPGISVPVADLEWSAGDVLEENRPSLDGEPYCWTYKAESDVWLYQNLHAGSSHESARSLKRLTAEFGPLTCTKGSHTGRIVGGA